MGGGGCLTEYTRRAIIIVPATDQSAANTLAFKVDKTGGKRTFTVGLATTPTGPPTHYWCGWTMTQAQWDALWSWFGDGTGLWRMYDSATWTPSDVLVATGLTVLSGL